MKSKRIFLVGFAGLAALALVAIPFSGVQAQSELKKLVFTAGPAGGGWYGMGGAVSELIKAKFPGIVATVIPGGGVGNNTVVEKGKAQFGLSSAPLCTAATMGTDPYTSKHTHLTTLTKIGKSDMGIFLVKADVPLNTIADLKKKKFPLRLTTTRKTSTPALAAKRLLKEYGVSFDDLKAWGGSVTFTNYSDAASLIADGHADGLIAVSVPAVRELVRRVKMKWLAPEEAAVESMIKKYGYAKNFVAKGKYAWAVEGGYTIGEPLIIIVRDDVPEKAVYTIMKAIAEKPDTIRAFGIHYKHYDPKTAWKEVGVALHPGAAKFYREAGYMK